MASQSSRVGPSAPVSRAQAPANPQDSQRLLQSLLGAVGPARPQIAPSARPLPGRAAPQRAPAIANQASSNAPPSSRPLDAQQLLQSLLGAVRPQASAPAARLAAPVVARAAIPQAAPVQPARAPQRPSAIVPSVPARPAVPAPAMPDWFAPYLRLDQSSAPAAPSIPARPSEAPALLDLFAAFNGLVQAPAPIDPRNDPAQIAARNLRNRIRAEELRANRVDIRPAAPAVIPELAPVYVAAPAVSADAQLRNLLFARPAARASSGLPCYREGLQRTLFLTPENLQHFQTRRQSTSAFLLTLSRAHSDRLDRRSIPKWEEILQHRDRVVEGAGFDAPALLARLAVEEVITAAHDLTRQNCPRFLLDQFDTMSRMRTAYRRLTQEQQAFRIGLFQISAPDASLSSSTRALLLDAREIAGVVCRNADYREAALGASELHYAELPVRLRGRVAAPPMPALSQQEIDRNLRAIEIATSSRPVAINDDAAVLRRAPPIDDYHALLTEANNTVVREGQNRLDVDELIWAFDELFRDRANRDVLVGNSEDGAMTKEIARERLQAYITWSQGSSAYPVEANQCLKLIVFEFRRNIALDNGKKQAILLAFAEAYLHCDPRKAAEANKQFNYAKGRTAGQIMINYLREMDQTVKENMLSAFYADARRFAPAGSASHPEPAQVLNRLRDLVGERFGLNRRRVFIEDHHRNGYGQVADRQHSNRVHGVTEYVQSFREVYIQQPANVIAAYRDRLNDNGPDDNLYQYVVSQLQRSNLSAERVDALKAQFFDRAQLVTEAGAKFLLAHDDKIIARA